MVHLSHGPCTLHPLRLETLEDAPPAPDSCGSLLQRADTSGVAGAGPSSSDQDVLLIEQRDDRRGLTSPTGSLDVLPSAACGAEGSTINVPEDRRLSRFSVEVKLNLLRLSFCNRFCSKVPLNASIPAMRSFKLARRVKDRRKLVSSFRCDACMSSKAACKPSRPSKHGAKTNRNDGG